MVLLGGTNLKYFNIMSKRDVAGIGVVYGYFKSRHNE